MGELVGNQQPVANNIDMGNDTRMDAPQTYKTDVEGVEADDVVKHGKDEFPCFDVSQEEFLQNMQDGRRRLRFKTEKAMKFMQGTKYNRPFFIRYSDENGKRYVRKVK